VADAALTEGETEYAGRARERRRHEENSPP
jgi:hypothetical protein